VRVGGARATLVAGHPTTVRVRFTREAQRALRRARRLDLRLRIVARSGGKRTMLRRIVKAHR
jgi:hypothetical protein